MYTRGPVHVSKIASALLLRSGERAVLNSVSECSPRYDVHGLTALAMQMQKENSAPGENQQADAWPASRTWENVACGGWVEGAS